MRGKLKHSISRRCPNCSHNLQVRVVPEKRMVKGEFIEEHIEIICCSNGSCRYEEKTEGRARKHLEPLPTE